MHQISKALDFDIIELSDFTGDMAYQEDEALNAKAQQMRQIAARINKAIIEKDIVIEEDGSLTINYWDNEYSE